jgi:hypothetical protein
MNKASHTYFREMKLNADIVPSAFPTLISPMLPGICCLLSLSSGTFVRFPSALQWKSIYKTKLDLHKSFVLYTMNYEVCSNCHIGRPRILLGCGIERHPRHFWECYFYFRIRLFRLFDPEPSM